jgi:hypothetical protein
MSFADVWYETSPYIYAPLGVLVLFGSDGTLAKVSAFLLVVAAGTILRLRWTYRRRRTAVRRRATRQLMAGHRARAQAVRPGRSASVR